MNAEHLLTNTSGIQTTPKGGNFGLVPATSCSTGDGDDSCSMWLPLIHRQSLRIGGNYHVDTGRLQRRNVLTYRARQGTTGIATISILVIRWSRATNFCAQQRGRVTKHIVAQTIPALDTRSFDQTAGAHWRALEVALGVGWATTPRWGWPGTGDVLGRGRPRRGRAALRAVRRSPGGSRRGILGVRCLDRCDRAGWCRGDAAGRAAAGRGAGALLVSAGFLRHLSHQGARRQRRPSRHATHRPRAPRRSDARLHLAGATKASS